MGIRVSSESLRRLHTLHSLSGSQAIPWCGHPRYEASESCDTYILRVSCCKADNIFISKVLLEEKKNLLMNSFNKTV